MPRHLREPMSLESLYVVSNTTIEAIDNLMEHDPSFPGASYEYLQKEQPVVAAIIEKASQHEAAIPELKEICGVMYSTIKLEHELAGAWLYNSHVETPLEDGCDLLNATFATLLEVSPKTKAEIFQAYQDGSITVDAFYGLMDVQGRLFEKFTSIFEQCSANSDKSPDDVRPFQHAIGIMHMMYLHIDEELRKYHAANYA